MKCRAAAKDLTEVQIWTNKTIKASGEELSVLSTGPGVDKTHHWGWNYKQRDKNAKFMPETHGLLKASLVEAIRY